MTQSVKSDMAPNANKRLARLVSVQALYQFSFGEDELSEIIRRCIDDGQTLLNGEETDGRTITGKPDPELLTRITKGVSEHMETLDEMLVGASSERISSERMERLLKAILRAGAFELYHHAEIPTAVIISDYVDVAHSFFNAKEPALVNAMLDKLAKRLRT